MKRNTFQAALCEGRMPIGHLVWEFGTRGLAGVLESAGLDFVLLDMEHSAFDGERIADLVGWLRHTRVTPIVRVPQRLYHFLARVMDAGALGVMVANVESAQQAREVVDAVKYAPEGRRGVGFGTAHTDYVAPDPVTYMQAANANTTVICMIESPTGLTAADEIAAIPGVDVLWVGHFDLTQAMGIPGQFEHPEFLGALSRVVTSAHRAGKAAGINPGSRQQAMDWRRVGFNVMSWSNDVAVYREGLSGAVADLRGLDVR
jgi:2-dehydro-3-deoxyglucarate aldolase/4-hydroxy-2-oxoheptanedioate aldolase